jgi:cytochrome c oxidase subunit 3
MSDSARALQHQFDDLDQQFEAAKLGMWAFLLTEIMMFGGLFMGYITYRWKYPAAYALGSHELDVVLGGINTLVLICSSLTMAMGVHAAQTGHRKKLVRFLLATLALGLVFLVIKYFEYAAKFAHHLVPGPHFYFDSPHAKEMQIFFSFYFALTGLHAFHMVIGAGILITLVVLSRRGRFGPAYYTPVEMSGLYWHFVDIVWIFLFPLLYLIGRHG